MVNVLWFYSGKLLLLVKRMRTSLSHLLCMQSPDRELSGSTLECCKAFLSLGHVGLWAQCLAWYRLRHRASAVLRRLAFILVLQCLRFEVTPKSNWKQSHWDIYICRADHFLLHELSSGYCPCWARCQTQSLQVNEVERFWRFWSSSQAP